MVKQVAAFLLALGLAGQASAQTDGFIARFEGGVGVIPVSNGAGPANPDGTFPNAKLNIVRGVNPGAGYVRIALVSTVEETVEAARRIKEFVGAQVAATVAR